MDKYLVFDCKVPSSTAISTIAPNRNQALFSIHLQRQCNSRAAAGEGDSAASIRQPKQMLHLSRNSSSSGSLLKRCHGLKQTRPIAG